jgi:cyanophycin synthetase
MNGVRREGARLLLALGAVGDRQDDVIDSLGETGARDADVVVIAHKSRYLRGRTTDELDALFRAAAARVGVADVPSYATEVDALEALVARAEPGDVVGLMCHEDREGVYDWLARQGFASDTPETLREKVRVARGS